MTLAIIPTYVTTPGDVDVLQTAVSTLRSTTSIGDLDVLIVDDGSPDSSLVTAVADVAAAAGAELVAKPENEGFSRTVNAGLRRALNDGQDALLVNADVEFIDPGWLERMLACTGENGKPAAVVGARLLYPTGLIQHAGVFFSLLHRSFGHIYQYAPADLPEAQRRRECPVTGALQLIRHSTLAQLGLYDEAFRLGFEDVDYCVRAFEAGLSCVYEPTVRAVHHESMFRGRRNEKLQRWQAESWLTFVQKYAQTNFVQWVPSLL